MATKLNRLQGQAIFTLLEILENYPIIWNIKLNEYSNKPMRDGQIEKMLIELADANLKMNAEEFKGN